MKYIVTVTKGEAWVWMHNSIESAMETARRLTEVTGGDVYVSQVVARFHQEVLCELEQENITSDWKAIQGDDGITFMPQESGEDA